VAVKNKEQKKSPKTRRPKRGKQFCQTKTNLCTVERGNSPPAPKEMEKKRSKKGDKDPNPRSGGDIISPPKRRKGGGANLLERSQKQTLSWGKVARGEKGRRS